MRGRVSVGERCLGYGVVLFLGGQKKPRVSDPGLNMLLRRVARRIQWADANALEKNRVGFAATLGGAGVCVADGFVWGFVTLFIRSRDG